MELSLTPEQDAFVATKLASGQYNSLGELIADALRLLEDQEQIRAHKHAEFQEEIQRRLHTLDRGEGIPGEEVEAYFRDKAARRRQQAA